MSENFTEGFFKKCDGFVADLKARFIQQQDKNNRLTLKVEQLQNEINRIETRFAEKRGELEVVLQSNTQLVTERDKLRLKVKNLKQNIKKMKMENFTTEKENLSKSKTIEEGHDSTSKPQSQNSRKDFEKLLAQIVADIKICGDGLSSVRFALRLVHVKNDFPLRVFSKPRFLRR